MTLLEAILLVVLVVILFLQTWRASLIPLAAVPVSFVDPGVGLPAKVITVSASPSMWARTNFHSAARTAP